MQFSETEIIEKIKNYGWYHTIQLTQTIKTPGQDSYLPMQEVPLQVLRMLERKDGKVLDIGSRDGLFSFEAEKLGAKEVIGIDNDLSPAAVEFLIPFF
ncbi:50S ribosomal protein L11 methyltransferase [Okeania sp.]|uniref:50S ribosomal protein L11 methyltransferase n=1 Tax=Okeania sp. TaxID=3100323 RepID=UPI002B4AE6FB|nr:50S ribosomal protein L11 methyltransferase [Okeania sp.]MEB3341815.1 50S ribosomal protein L11 methyltransferase [Okeania sp.]